MNELDEIKAKLSPDEWAFIESVIERAYAEGYIKGKRVVVHRRVRDSRGLFEKTIDFVFGE